jgi:hypothetical protein
MKTPEELQTFCDWQEWLQQMEASDVHNFLEYSFEQQKPWKDRINFLTAAVDRFLTLAGFSRTLLKISESVALLRLKSWQPGLEPGLTT